MIIKWTVSLWLLFNMGVMVFYYIKYKRMEAKDAH